MLLGLVMLHLHKICSNCFHDSSPMLLRWLEKPETVKSYDAMHQNINAFIKKALRIINRWAFG